MNPLAVVVSQKSEKVRMKPELEKHVDSLHHIIAASVLSHRSLRGMMGIEKKILK